MTKTSKKVQHSVKAPRPHRYCKGGCGYTVLSRRGPLSRCYACRWLWHVLKSEGVRSVAALAKISHFGA